MKNIFSLSMLAFSMLAFTSCEEIVDLDLETSEPKPVIEGLVTDQPGLSYVKLTMSNAYFNVQNLGTISNAQVEVTDNDGNLIPFSETGPGLYHPDSLFTGQIQKSYTLKVTINGRIFSAASMMRKVTNIEKVTTKYFDKNNSEFKEEGYYVYISFNELPGQGDSYKVDLFVNGKSVINRPGNLFYFNDKYIDGGNVVDWEFAQKVEKNDSLKVRMYSLSEEGYKFYDAIYNLSNAGGLFGKNPANVPTNIIGDAFGYFGASSINEKSTVVE